MKALLKVSQQTLWQVLGKIVTSLSTFLILGMITRKFGAEGTGVFTLALTYLAIFYLLADFGFNGHVLKQAQNSKLKVQNQWNKLLGTRILWSVLLIILALITLPFWPFATPLFSQAVLVGSLAILGSAVFISCNLIFQSKLRYDLSVLASSLGTILTTLLVWYLLSNNFYLPSVLAAHMVGWLMIALVSLLLVKKFIKNIFPKFDFSYSFDLLKNSWPIAVTLALNVVYFRADTFMVSYFKGMADAGIYNIAYSFFQVTLVLPTFIMNAYYPLMLRSLKELKTTFFSLFGLSIAATITTIFLAPFLINLLTGGGFLGSVKSLQILSLGFPAYFLSAILMWFFIREGRYKTLLLIYLLGLLLNLALNLVYIPKYSFIASSIITVVSEYVILLLQLIFLKRIKNDN